MTADPLVSILINNHNYGRYLPAAIDSALQQTYPRVEVIVVDDGSTDGSRALIEAYGDRIVPVLKENGGQPSAFNAGFARSRGEIVCLLDSDDLFLPNKVERVVEVLGHHPEAPSCMHLLQHVDSDLGLLQQPRPSGESGVYDVRSPIARGKLRGFLPFHGTATSGLSFTRKLLDQLLPMPESRLLHDDYLKFGAWGLAPCYVLLEPLALQRIHGTNFLTLQPDKAGLHAGTTIATAYWLRRNLPVLARFSNNIFASALATYRRLGCDRPDLPEIIDTYLGSLGPWESLQVRLRTGFHRLRAARGVAQPQ